MKLSVAKTFTFDSAHHLPGYDGPCANLHGHQWKLEVEVTGKIDGDTGMVMDFVKLKKIVNDLIVSHLDHKLINDVYAMPTAENMVQHFVVILEDVLAAQGVELTKLSLWETPTSVCTWRRSHCSC